MCFIKKLYGNETYKKYFINYNTTHLNAVRLNTTEKILLEKLKEFNSVSFELPVRYNFIKI